MPTAFSAEGKSIAANPRQHTVTFAPDALTTAELSDCGSTYDQVIVRGARRRSICTLTYLNEIVRQWSLAEQGAYRLAASGDPDYGAWTPEQRRQANQMVRSESRVDRVFRLLEITHEWDWTIGGESVFPGLPSGIYPRDIEIADNLPIKPGVDWSGDIDVNWYERSSNRTWIGFFADPRPSADLPGVDRISLDRMASGVENFSSLSELSDAYSYTIEASVWARYISLHVNGAPQHVIASSDAMLADDISNAGGLDYKTFAATVCLEEDRYCEGVYPSSVTADVVRRLVLYAGDDYQQVWVHPNTVAGFDPDGARRFSNGGWLRDDSPKLRALAQLIATGLVPARKRANWRSTRRISSIGVGDLITTAGGATVNAPVMEVRIAAPTSVGSPAAMPTQSFTTFGGTFDPLAVLRRVGVTI